MAPTNENDACGEEITVVELDDSRNTRPCSHLLPCPWHGGRYDDVVGLLNTHMRSIIDQTVTAATALERLRADVRHTLQQRANRRRAI